MQASTNLLDQFRDNCSTVFLKENIKNWPYLLSYFGVFLMSIFICFAWIKPEILHNRLIYDAEWYFNLSVNIEKGYLYDPVRTIGYPVFLYATRRLASLIGISSWTKLLYLIQFLLHTLTAVCATHIFRCLQKCKGRKPAHSLNLLVFGLIQLNLCLLPLTLEVLTDSVSVFCFTVALSFIMSSSKYKHIGLGGSLGLAALVRPFYSSFAVVVLGMCVGDFLLKKKYLSQSWKTNFWISVQVAGSFIFFTSPQLGLIYKHENRISLVGAAAAGQLDYSKIVGRKSYKYETIGTETTKPVLIYLRALGDKKQSLVKSVFDNISFYTAKTVGIFQSFEWSVYRAKSDSNPKHPVFIFGALNLFFFISMGFGLISIMISDRILQRNDYFFLLGLIGLSHILLYSIIVSSEARYIAPVIPLIIVLGTHHIAQKSLVVKTTLFLISVLLYSLTWYKITQFPKLLSRDELNTLVESLIL